MRDVHTIISALHHTVNTLDAAANHHFRELEAASRREELGAHPDDLPDLQMALKLDAMVLRRLACELDDWHIRLEQDTDRYQAAAE